MLQRISKRALSVLLVASWLSFFVLLVTLDYESSKEDLNSEGVLAAWSDMSTSSDKAASEPVPITNKEPPRDNRVGFSYSPDKKHIAFLESVFEEFGNNYDKYWALKVSDTKTRKEKTLLVDDYHLSDYEWRSTTTIRVIHNAGTGVRVFRDIDINLGASDLYDHFIQVGREAEFWQIDEPYVQEAQNVQLAREAYYGR